MGWHCLSRLEARRGEVYAAFYSRQGAAVCETMPGMVTTPDALCTLVMERTLFVGSGVRTYGGLFAATLGAQAVCLESALEGELAATVARLGRTRLHGGSPARKDTLKPLYIRAADARLPRHPMAVATHDLPRGTTVPGG